jgi:hypothetical protein
MFHFSGFLPLRDTWTTPGGLPHSDICGSKAACASPQLLAACHVLLRLLVPRHPPYALITLFLIYPSFGFPLFTCQSAKSEIGKTKYLTQSRFCRFISTDVLLRKEVIQPHLPVRLPCYDFTPLTRHTFDESLPYGLSLRLRVHPTRVV